MEELLEKVQEKNDLFIEKLYDLKEAIIDGVENTDSLKRMYANAAIELNAAIKKSIVIVKVRIDPIVKKAYMDDLLEMICSCADLSKEELLNSGKSRKRIFVIPRQIHVALLVKVFGMTQAKATGIYGQDHCTAIHSAKTVVNLYATDRFYRENYGPVFELCLNYDAITGSEETKLYLNLK